MFYRNGEQAVVVRERISLVTAIPPRFAPLKTSSEGPPILRPPFSRPFTGDNATLPVYPGIRTERFRE